MKDTAIKKKTNPFRYSFEKNFRETPLYKRLKIYKDELGLEAYLNIKTKEGDLVPIPVCDYAFLFSHFEISLMNLVTDKIEKINVNRDLWPIYLNGFNNGKRHFNENFEVTGEVVYGKHSKIFERTLHRHFYHTNYNNFDEGWNYYQNWVSSVIDSENLDKWGFYHGILNEFIKLKKLHPIVFENFSQCNSTDIRHTTPQQKVLEISIKMDLVNEIYDSIHHLFEDSKSLKTVLSGRPIDQKLNFTQNQNQLVELFRKLFYNNELHDSKINIIHWLQKFFRFYDSKTSSYKEINPTTSYELITTGKGEPNKAKRICEIPSLPYKRPTIVKDDKVK